ncbi:N6-adenosine-methyltransferase subunit METTL3 [Taenia solium]|eukprot:TsM_000407800 transcript=TsM_000407800 gene=TsM_000407800
MVEEVTERRMLRSEAADGQEWLKCDIRQFDTTVIGTFGVIMTDPLWGIHMEPPYATMSGDEMRKMDIPCLQNDVYIFIWVTGL